MDDFDPAKRFRFRSVPLGALFDQKGHWQRSLFNDYADHQGLLAGKVGYRVALNDTSKNAATAHRQAMPLLHPYRISE